ncbi:glycosyltransferase family 2 protein [Roseiconus nitratireducens]|uniref:Glycosyltransferase family 2 protein n=1 Tax=Roseiconus nitratireducens TaxID=2605748 RepID=A0A5M6CY02_9BACT|nr:glycosyltransferase family 2 protein [Roseiconus nitratireducens]KAA5540084.1 glycosyltransferase family 2 protein [Roseiconus nitratireducens]
MTRRTGTETWLAALPVYNEVDFVDGILDQVVQYADHVLVVDDGSTDGTSERLAKRSDVSVIRHEQNRGYGAALKTAFEYTLDQGYDGVVTLDCDGQHQPKRIPAFIDSAQSADIVSGSRYLHHFDGDDAPPEERMFINRRITADLNRRLGLKLTDSFCGFKAYRSEALRQFEITDTGYAMPLQLWVQAAEAGLRIVEMAVPLIYLDLERSFGGALDHAETRLAHYNAVIDTEIARLCASGRHVTHASSGDLVCSHPTD